MTVSEADKKILRGLVWALKPSDLSILEDMLKEQKEGAVSLRRNSAHDKFWSQLAIRGLAKEMPTGIDLGSEKVKTASPGHTEALSNLKSFSATLEGKKLLSEVRESAASADMPASDSLVSPEAIEILRLYAEEGDAASQWKLALAYFSGTGITRNASEGAKWLQKAAESGHAPATYKLGKLYATGHGVQRDNVAAYMWFGLAIAAGMDAAKDRDAVADLMSHDEIKRGNRLIVDWKQKKQAPAQDPEGLLQLILTGLIDERGVHVQTAFALLGALAGFATQMAIREKLIKHGQMTEDQVFATVTKNGQKYYISTYLLDPLLRVQEGRASLLSVSVTAAANLGAKVFPNMGALAKHIESSFGSESYGMPPLPAEFAPRYNPFEMLRDTWDTVAIALKVNDGGDPLTWPFALIGAIQRFIAKSKGKLEPTAIVPIIMGSALAMSHIDPALISGESERHGTKRIDLGRTDRGKLLQSGAFQAALEATKEQERKR